MNKKNLKNYIGEQVFGTDFKHFVSTAKEELEIYGMKLSRTTELDERIFPPAIGVSRYYVNEKEIVFWSFDSKTGQITIIDGDYAYGNGKFKPVDINA